MACPDGLAPLGMNFGPRLRLVLFGALDSDGRKFELDGLAPLGGNFAL
jgi:hypothetical protein